MTKERRRELKELVMSLMEVGVNADDCYELEECIDKVYESDKYRWHDLIQDPADLPGVSYHHQVIFQWVGSIGCTWYDCGWFYADEQEDEPYFSTHNVHMLIGNDYRHVIGWAYIQPFEEDEE